MKRQRWILSFLLLVSMILSACGGETASPTTVAVAPTNTTAAAGPTNTGAVGAPTNTTAPAAPAAEATATLVTTGPAGPDVLTVLSLWGGSEQEAFQKVLADFTATTGIQTQYQQARDFAPALRTMIAAGNPPMVAIVPRPGIMADFAAEGSLIELTTLGITMADVNASYSQAWTDLGSVEGKLYGIAVKANSKSTVWYRPNSFQQNGWEVPTTYDELIALSDQMVAAGKTPWAVGGGDSWTLTDLFEILYLRSAGPEKYNELFQFGTLPFTDASVVSAANMMTKITNTEGYVQGGAEGVLATKFVDGIGLVLGKSPSAEMYFEGGFVGGIATDQVNPDLVIGTDIDFFPFPIVDEAQGEGILGAGDQLSVFQDTPQSRAFLKYMISAQAGTVWAKTGAIISPNKQVDVSVYPNELAQKEAQQLGAATAFRFDGSDQLPGSLADDWGTALQGMVDNPADTQRILEDYEAKAAREFGR